MRTRVEVSLPIIQDLRASIDATPVVGTATFLVTQYGRSFTAEGFGNKMRDWCKEAGLPGLNSHGVRKAAATRMAEHGASVHALMATFAWLDIKQAERYTRESSASDSHASTPIYSEQNRGEEIPHLGSQNGAVRENGAKKRG